MIKILKRIAQTQGINYIVQKQLLLQLTELVHRLTYEKRDSKMAEAIKRFKISDNKKPLSQIKKEIILCKKFWKCYPFHYYRYDLYRNDKQLTEQELINYVPEFFFYYLFIPYYNSNKYQYLVADKNQTEQLFRRLSIPQAPTICKILNMKIYTCDLLETDYLTIEKQLTKNNIQTFFVKPVKGMGGHGIFIFNRDVDGVYITKEKTIFTENFIQSIAKQNDYIVQTGIEQDKEIAAIYPYSINTIRFLSQNKKGEIRIVFIEYG